MPPIILPNPNPKQQTNPTHNSLTMARSQSPRRSSRRTENILKSSTKKRTISPPPTNSTPTNSRSSPRQTPSKNKAKSPAKSSDYDMTPSTRRVLFDSQTGSPLRFKLANKSKFATKEEAARMFSSMPEDSQMNVTRGRGSKAAPKRAPSGSIPDFGFEYSDSDSDKDDFYETQKRPHHVELRSNPSQFSSSSEEEINVERLPKIVLTSNRQSNANEIDKRLEYLEKQIRIEKMELELSRLHSLSSKNSSPLRSSTTQSRTPSPVRKSAVKSNTPSRSAVKSHPKSRTPSPVKSLSPSKAPIRRRSSSPVSAPPSPTKQGSMTGSSSPKRKMKGIGRQDMLALTEHIAKHPSVIVSTTIFEKKPRKQRVAWSDEEVHSLERGVRKHGKAWSKIIVDNDLTFNSTRSEIDLKDKWRNLKNYKEFSTLAKRTYMVLTAEHTPFLNPTTNNPYRFVNKWPRDAALKAASRPEMYQDDSSTCIIYIKEILSENYRAHPAVPVPVHVFECSRSWQQAPTHLNKLGKVSVVTVTDAKKIREERCINQEDWVKIVEDLNQNRFR